MSFRIIQQWERGVVLRFGKFLTVKNPGIRFVLPVVDKLVKVSVSDQVKNIPQQSLITKDNVTVTVDSSVQYKVVDAYKSVVNVANLDEMLLDRAKMAMRSTVGSFDVDEVLHDTPVMMQHVKDVMQSTADNWGISIENIQIKDIIFDASVKQSMAVIAEAERNARAKIINAEADIATAEKYAEAAKVYSENPITLRLREFQLWQNVSKNPASSIYVIPSNLLDKIGDVK